MKKKDIIGIILSFILVLSCIPCAIFINRICIIYIIAPIWNIIFLLNRNKKNSDDKT